MSITFEEYYDRFLKPKKKAKKHRTYPEDWEKWRRWALKRANYRCQRCGSKGKLHVHHIIEVAKGGKNEPNNLIALCEGCHSIIHPHMWSRYLRKLQFELFMRSEDPVHNLFLSFLKTIMAFKPKEVPFRESEYNKSKLMSPRKLSNKEFQAEIRRITKRAKREEVKR